MASLFVSGWLTQFGVYSCQKSQPLVRIKPSVFWVFIQRGWFNSVFFLFIYALCLLNLLIWCNVLVCQLSIGFRLMPTPLCYMMSLLHTEWVCMSKIFYIALLIVLSAVIMLLFHRADSTHKWWHCWQDAVLTSKCIKHPARISVFMNMTRKAKHLAFFGFLLGLHMWWFLSGVFGWAHAGCEMYRRPDATRDLTRSLVQ